MLFLPAAALCCLCSALVAMAAQLIQNQLSVTRKAGETVSIGCTGFDECDNTFVYWYQKKDTFTVLLRFDRSGQKPTSRFSHPQKMDFSAMRSESGCELVISNSNSLHSATYYCTCQKVVPVEGASESDKYLIFGSGTKLYVNNEQVVKPVVSVYPAASRGHLGGKTSLLCVASHMVPPEVKFLWKRRKQNGHVEELPPADGEQLEFEESGRVVSIREVDRAALNTYKYRCSVKHEWGTVEAPTEQGKEGLVTAFGGDSCEEDSVSPSPEADGGGVLHWHRHRLLCIMYTVLIAKGVVYCCGLSLLRILRGKASSTNSIEDDS